MDIDTLKKIIKSSLKDNLFFLDTALLESESITAIAIDNFPNNTLQITPDSKTPIIEPADGKSIIAMGIGIDDPFNGLPMQAMFYILNQEAALTISATGDAGWTLEQSFPLFYDTLGALILFNMTPTPPTLYLLSDPQQDRSKGLSFEGNIDFSAMSGGLVPLLGIQSQQIKGEVILKNGASQFQSINFQSPEITDVNLWIAKNCTIQFSIANYLLENPYFNTYTAVPYIEMDSVIPFQAQGNLYTLPISVRLTNFESDIWFRIELSDAIDAALDEISVLANNAGLSGILPPASAFPIEKILKLSDFFFTFNSATAAISSIGLQVESVSPWTIVHIDATNKTLTAENVKLNFTVITPFSSPSPYIIVSGDISLTPMATISIMGSYPNWEIQGYLKEGSVLSIKEVIEEFVGPVQEIPDLSVIEFGFDVQSESYTFDIGLTGSWLMNPDSNLVLTVEELRFSIVAMGEEKTAQFSGNFSIGSVGIYVTADYSSSLEESGWQFSGGTEPGQLIAIGDFITYLTQAFSVGSPPAWIQKITLQDLKTDFNTLSKDFDFSITGNIPIGANETLQIIIGFSMAAQGVVYTKTLFGSFSIGAETFTLIFSTNPAETSLSAQWLANDPSGYLQLEDIAKTFGFSSIPPIPEGLDLALESASLFYDFTVDSEVLILSAQSANYGSAIFIAKKINQAWTYVFGVNIAIKGIDLAGLPLVGSDLASTLGTVAVDDIQILIAEADISPIDVQILNELIQAHATEGSPTLPVIADGLKKGVYASIDLVLGANTFAIQVSTASNTNISKTLLKQIEYKKGESTLRV